VVSLADSMGICRDAALRCVGCGLCEQVQNEGCGCAAGTWGPFAERVVEQADAGAFDPRTERLLFTCALCGACTVSCPVGIDATAVVCAGRELYLQVKPELSDRWRPMRVDYAGHAFRGIRAWQGVRYDDALAAGEPCESVFFPGCTLTTYAPALTRATMAFLRDAGLAAGMTDLCCGKPVRLMGLAQQYDGYAQAIGARLAAHGVRRVIAGCPNCYYELLHAKEQGLIDAGIEVQALPRVLLEAGLRVPEERGVAADARTFSVHDSCSDRQTDEFGSAVRALLPSGSCREMRHHGADTICCGSGGVVSYYDVRVCEGRRARRMAEFGDTGADCLVTACVSCANSMLRADGAAPVRHYLELLFDVEIDWEAYRQASESFAATSGFAFDRAEDNEPLLGPSA